MKFNNIINEYFIFNKRILSFRKSKNPYTIWVSEIIFQQTRINQGLPYYEKFILKYPTVQKLASSTLEEVLHSWQGLGYYSRARNLYKAAQIIVDKYKGEIPDNYKDLIKLPGIGDYTASAILSIAYNKPYAAVDGNVIRLLSRYFGIYENSSTAKGKNIFKQKAEFVLSDSNYGAHNEAMMEYGATVCLPKPKCEECMLAEHCYAYQNGVINELPVKDKSREKRELNLDYLLITRGDKIALKKRKTGFWKGLYELVDANLISYKAKKETVLFEKIHILTHLKLNIRIFAVSFEDLEELQLAELQDFNYSWMTKDEFDKLPFPIVLRNFLNEYT